MDISRYFPMWEQLTAQQRSALSGSAVCQDIKRGTVIHSGSADCLGFSLICSGQLRAYILSDEGREITIYRLFEWDICLFTASCIMRSIQFDIIIEAEKDSRFWVIPPKVYQEVMERSAPLANYTNEIMASRFSEVMWLIEQIMWKSFDRRLASFLLEEASIEGTDCLKITHEIIGNHMGNAREVVTRMLRYFQSEGMVSLSRGTVELKDTERLEELAGK